MKRIGFCALVILAGLLLSIEARQPGAAFSPKRVRLERDQLLFLEGAKALAKGRYDEARILLNTMRWTYSDSPLIDEAKVLIFSSARQGGPKNEESARLLQEIQRIIEDDDHKTERIFKPPQ